MSKSPDPREPDRYPDTARWWWALAGALALALWGQTAAPANSPMPQGQQLQPFEANYSWYWRSMRVAVSTISLEHRDNDTWVYSSWATPRGVGRLYPLQPRLQSVMRLTPQGVEPLSYRVSGSGSSRDSDVMFDWIAARAVGINEGERINLPIRPGVQDDLSVQVAMLVQLLQGRTPAVALELDKDAVREYDYTREGVEQLSTALGPVETIVYAAHHPGSPRTTRFWCAPALGYIPMQVQQKRLNVVEWSMRIQSLKRG